jgi:hypothetical protein
MLQVVLVDGVTLVVAQQPSIRVGDRTIGLWIRVDDTVDTKQKGLAHMAEHLLSRIIREEIFPTLIGATPNRADWTAATSLEDMKFVWDRPPVESLLLVAAAFLGLIRRPVLNIRPELFTEEHGRAVAELELAADDAQASLEVLTLRTVYPGYPIGVGDPAGELESVRSIELNEVRDYIPSLLKPKNCILSMVFSDPALPEPAVVNADLREYLLATRIIDKDHPVDLGPTHIRRIRFHLRAAAVLGVYVFECSFNTTIEKIHQTVAQAAVMRLYDVADRILSSERPLEVDWVEFHGYVEALLDDRVGSMARAGYELGYWLSMLSNIRAHELSQLRSVSEEHIRDAFAVTEVDQSVVRYFDRILEMWDAGTLPEEAQGYALSRIVGLIENIDSEAEDVRSLESFIRAISELNDEELARRLATPWRSS